MSTLLAVLIVLAVARFARLVAIDEIAEPFRRRAVRLVERRPSLADSVAYLVTCPWCISIWLWPLVAVAVFVSGPVVDPWLWVALLTLVGSLAAGLVVTVEDRLDRE